MSEQLLTKRLHISGLTPSIAPADLERRLSSFGKVKAMDGFSALDALGDPRKFGYVTMEIGAKELAKCFNVLSGSTWKGAKLRIGEAKPDFRERLAHINSQPPRTVRPKRTRARNHGYPSSTLPPTPLSAATAASTPGWIVTSSGRVVRPMRMRPERPLGPMRSEVGAAKVKGVNGKAKRRIKPSPIRARRRLIDPTKWDSVYLKGVFLDVVPVSLPTPEDARERPSLVRRDIVDENGEDMDEDTIHSDDTSVSCQGVLQVQGHARPALSASQSFNTPSRIPGSTESVDVRGEVNAALTMLGKIFGDREDWEGRECVDQLEGLDDNGTRDEEMQMDETEDIEFVPRDFGEKKGRAAKIDKGKGKEKTTEDVIFAYKAEVDMDAAHDRDVEMKENDTEVSAPPTNLKALFAPREDASFSLVNHLDLDLDLELDADIFGISAPPGASQENAPPEPILSTSQAEIPAMITTTKARSRVTLDRSLPLTFPSLNALPHPYSTSNPTTTTHQHDALSCFLFPPAKHVRGLHHLPSGITFTRSLQDTPESIRERWEKDKSSLTHEWKKAWREARGRRRGRSGAGDEIGGSY